MLTNINLWAVVVAVGLNTVVAMLWYSSALFGEPWSALTGQSIAGPPQPHKLITGVACGVVFVFGYAWMFGAVAVQSPGQAAFLAVVVGSFIVAAALPTHLYNGYPLKLMLIDSGLTLFVLVLDTIVLYLFMARAE